MACSKAYQRELKGNTQTYVSLLLSGGGRPADRASKARSRKDQSTEVESNRRFFAVLCGVLVAARSAVCSVAQTAFASFWLSFANDSVFPASFLDKPVPTL